MNNGCCRNAANPCQSVQRGNPRPDTICANRRWSLMLNRDLGEVGPQLNPVVDEESKGDQWPGRREQGEIAELKNELSNIFLDVVVRKRRLVSNPVEEVGFLGFVGAHCHEHNVVGVVLAVKSVPVLHLVLHEWQDVLLKETDQLASYRKRNNLIPQPVLVHLE